MNMNAMERLNKAIAETNCRIVAGLDPTVEMLPAYMQGKIAASSDKAWEEAKVIEEFCRDYIWTISDIVPAIKINSAFFEKEHLQPVYRSVARYAKSLNLYVIGDLKRADIGSTSKAYAEAWLGEDQPFDAITINPYFGTDGVKPLIEMAAENEKGVFVLVKTSNDSSAEIQDQVIFGSRNPVYHEVAHLVNMWGASVSDGYYYNPVGAVVGATHPKDAELLRAYMPNTMFLVPGYGAQGATAKDVAVNFDQNGLGAIVNSSRGLMCAYKKDKYKEFVGEFGKGWEEATKAACLDAKEDINNAL